MADRLDIFADMADAYTAFLNGFPWEMPLAYEGGREGINKFIKNAFLGAFRGNKYRKAPLATPAAAQRLTIGLTTGLVLEHVVPTVLLQRPAEQAARSAQLTREFVLSWLRRYWVTATVTKDEDRRLIRDQMPDRWDGVDVFARYRQAGMALMPNPVAVPGLPQVPSSTMLP